jgi:hypothetical protein
VAYLEEDADEALGYAMAASQKSLTANQHALESMLMLVHHIESAGNDATYYARLPFMATARQRIEELRAVIAEASDPPVAWKPLMA